MSSKCREEYVGKRFLSIRNEVRLKVCKIAEWEWRSGIIRAVSSRDSSNPDFIALVEFDDTGWKYRERVKVHDVFQEFIVEHNLAWVPRKDPSYQSSKLASWPALCYKAIVDKAGIYEAGKRPVEFLSDRKLGFIDEHDAKFYKEGDENSALVAIDYPEVKNWVKNWTDYQDGQKILLTTPTVLLGYRVEVYRTEGTTQWYTAVIKSYNHQTKIFCLTDDTVLEEHNADPTLIQMHLIGDGVVESILNGVDVGVAQRRRPRSTVTKQNSKESSNTASRGGLCTGSGQSSGQSRAGSSQSVHQSVSKSSKSAATTVSETDQSATPTQGSGLTKGRRPVQSKRKLDTTGKASRSKPVVSPNNSTKKTKKDFEDHSDSAKTICNQTCNVVVKRIEEEHHEGKSPRLKEKSPASKKSTDAPTDVKIQNSAETNADLSPKSDVELAKAKSESVVCKTEKSVSPKAESKPLESLEKKVDSCDSLNAAANPCLEPKTLTSASPREEESPPQSTPPGQTPRQGDGVDTSEKSLSKPNSLSLKVKDDEPAVSQSKDDEGKSLPVCEKLALTPQHKETSKDISNSLDSSKLKSESGKTNPTGGCKGVVKEDMNYKKEYLRARGNTSPTQSAQFGSVSEGIDVNRSLTEQLAKRSKTLEQYSINGDRKHSGSESSVSTDSVKSPPTFSAYGLNESNQKPETHAERQSAFTCVQSSLPRSTTLTPASEVRSDSRASDSLIASHTLEDKRPASRVDDIRSVRSSPGSSPFVIDRFEAVHPYRDPELMRKNPVQSNVQSIIAAQQQQHKMNPSSFPGGPPAVPGSASASQNAAAAAAFSGVPGVPPQLPPRNILSSLPSTLAYTSSPQLPPSMSPHLALQHASLEAMARAQQQQMAAMHSQLIAGYPPGAPAMSAALEAAIWPRKLANTPLCGDLAAIHREQLQLHLEQESRRERERMERERREQQDRLEQERREKERMERERAEKEKAERERAERERIERERERAERDRQERERIMEKERQEWENKQNQERILNMNEMNDTQAAVEQHFAESLRHMGILRGGGAPVLRSYLGKPETHQLPPHGMPFQDVKLKREMEQVPDDKRYLNKAAVDEKMRGSFPPGYHPPYSAGSQHYPQPGHKPVFNLYPFTGHSTISSEQLKKHLPEQRSIKEDPDKKHYSTHGPHTVNSSHHPGSVYLPKDLKREPHNSVIVKRDIKQEIKMEHPVAAHSHHNSPSSSSPRPQHPRPAHTPEHRPERPLSSSTSPAASGIPHHLLHHSSSGPGVPPSHHSHPGAAFRGVEAHVSRSQSPYRPVASQSQHTMPMALDYHKSSGPSKLKVGDAHPAVAHQIYSSQAAPQVSAAASTASSAYSFSLIQQGLVPNPIYSQVGGSQHSEHLGQQQQPRMPTSVATGAPRSQVSPPGMKRKPVPSGKDGSLYNRKKMKTQAELGPQAAAMSIPVTCPEILTNPSPYTTTSSNSVFSKPGSAATSQQSTSQTASASSHLSASSNISSLNSKYENYSLKSFVEHAVHSAFQQENEQKEKAEREKVISGSLATQPSVYSKVDVNQLDRKCDVPRPHSDSQTGRPLGEVSQSGRGGHSESQHGGRGEVSHTAGRPLSCVSSQVAAGQHVQQSDSLSTPNTSSDAPSSSISRIMDTINRVANNQTDTDSDTLSASSPPPTVKPADTSSPLSRSGNSSGPSRHHMKKAWLQRHDEDKKSEVPVTATPPPPPPPPPVSTAQEDGGSTVSGSPQSLSSGISCVENPGAHGEGGATGSVKSSPASVVVTLPNGNVPDLNHRNDESTSSASEAEMQTKTPGSKKRVVKSRKSGGGGAGAVTAGSGSSVKKSKTEAEQQQDSAASVQSDSPPTPIHTNNNNINSRKKTPTGSTKKNKPDKDGKSKEDSPVSKRDSDQAINPSKQASDTSPQPSKQNTEKKTPSVPPSVAPVVPPPSQAASISNVSSPSSHSERSSPSLSESSSSTSASNSKPVNSTLNSTKENKDKKKARRSKDAIIKGNKNDSSFNKPLVKQTVATLKKTMSPFIQDGPCSEITPKLNKCRECKMTPVQRSKKLPNIFCRFYAFRRLKYSSRGVVTIDGFSELSDADPDDIEPWLPRFPVEEPDLDVENSKFIISKVGDKFCELVEQEKEAKSWAGEIGQIAWKRAVTGVREMCDVCDTTLFNMHWVCQKCGFVVCLDCYKVRIKEGKRTILDDKWLTCSSNRQPHEASKMMLTQIIPSDALWELGRLIHDIRMKWSIPSSCPCGVSNGKLGHKNGIAQILSVVNSKKLPNGVGPDESSGKSLKSKKDSGNPLKTLGNYNPDTSSSPLSILAEVASMEPDSNREKAGDQNKLDKTTVPGDEFLEESEKKSGCTSLRELLTKTAGKPKNYNEKKGKKNSGTTSLGDIIQSVVEKNSMDGGAPFKFMHYTPRLGGWKREMPIITHSLTETSVLYPDIPHSWLCDGRLLRLHDAHHKGNLKIFQEQWRRGQPVLVSLSNKHMNLNLWKPEVFSQEFGEIENEVVNCRTGAVIIGHTMSDFWDGFEMLRRRPLDDNNEPILLKLKDWPPGDDFSDFLPSRFQDLMKSLPLPEYTHRTGKLNLASRLPDFSVRPDLGPKMYNAYGSSHFPKEATTNLHLDISDAVNVMVYVGIPGDGPGGRKAQEEAAVKAIDDAGCDSITKRRVREVNEVPGALWHIYDAHDADKIRDFLNKVAKERGESIEKDHDAIHDQSWYIDKELGDRLYKEYGVQGYPIVQCAGDAIFIPAGAPHQVRNLHSCIKVAEDFVSPEHLNHCFRLTQEFRQLSETHSNHEDKLQVKNIIYHAVKDAISVLRENDPDDE